MGDIADWHLECMEEEEYMRRVYGCDGPCQHPDCNSESAAAQETDMDVTNLQIKIFKNVSDNDRAPKFKGIISDPNNEYAKVAEVSLWYADDRETGEQKLDSNGNPFLTGKTQPPFVRS